MTISCQIVDVTELAPSPANISVDYIRVLSAPGVDMTTCVAPCTPSGTIVKWRNDGDTEGTFVPKVIVTNIDTGVQIEMTAPGGTITIPAHYTSPPMGIYSPTLDVGTYTFCPVENPTNVCITITVIAPLTANITATNIVVSQTSCVIPCNITIGVTWTNNGGVAGTFIPAILVDTTRYTKPSVSLGPGQSGNETFVIAFPNTGTFTICPDPN